MPADAFASSPQSPVTTACAGPIIASAYAYASSCRLMK